MLVIYGAMTYEISYDKYAMYIGITGYSCFQNNFRITSSMFKLLYTDLASYIIKL